MCVLVCVEQVDGLRPGSGFMARLPAQCSSVKPGHVTPYTCQPHTPCPTTKSPTNQHPTNTNPLTDSRSSGMG